jgi:DNA adenine methylase
VKLPMYKDSLPSLADYVVNVASVPQRSPFRYPGGKTWLVPYVRRWLSSITPPLQELIEPFAGGSIVGLTAAFENLAKKVTLVELDPDVASVWKTILHGDVAWLANRVMTFNLTLDSARALLAAKPHGTKERAFITIVRNRVQRGGILAPGAGVMKDGENGKGIRSRWYPATLRKRMLDIAAIRGRIRFVEGDGLAYMERRLQRERVAFFVDPPYTVAGRRLYRYSDIDHERLFWLARRLAGNLLMTYDDSQEIRRLILRYRLDCETILMKNTHHTRMQELLISRDLGWVRRPDTSQLVFREFFPQRDSGSLESRL